MGLMAMLAEVLNGKDETETVATVATVKLKSSPSVASVATVTVTSSPKPQSERSKLRLIHTAGDSTEQEAALSARRVQLFQDKGISDHEAAAMARRLVQRDRELDDRRSCAECSSFHAGICRQRITPIGETTIYTLHRCKGFQEGVRYIDHNKEVDNSG